MIIPVKCFTCGNVVGSAYEPFVERMKAGEDPAAVLDDLGLERFCCRRMVLAHINLIDEVMPFD